MNKKVRQLYCTDLLVANPESDSLANLQKDIEAVKEQGYTYKMCELPEASQVQYFTKDGKNPSYRAVLRRRRRQSKKRKWYA